MSRRAAAPPHALAALLLAAATAGCGAAPPPAPHPAPIPVGVVAVRRDAISEVLKVSGQTAALRALRLAAPVAGRITMLAVHPGDRLAAGAVAARILPLEDEAALQGFAFLHGAGALGARGREMAPRLERELRAHAIPLRVPFAAVVAQRLRNPDEQVAANDALLELFDPASLYVVAQVPVEAAGRIAVGMPVDLIAGGARAAGRIVALVPAVAPQSLTVPVRVTLTTPLQPPLLQAAVECRITVAHHAAVLLIPRSALISSAARRRGAVMVAVAGRARRRTIDLGLQTAKQIEVLAGLQAGDLVLSHGQYALPDGTPIRPQRAAPE